MEVIEFQGFLLFLVFNPFYITAFTLKKPSLPRRLRFSFNTCH